MNGLRLPSLLVASAALCAGLAGCQDRSGMPAPREVSRDPKRMTPSELQQYVSTKAAVAGADAGATLTQLPSAPLELLAPPAPTIPAPPRTGRTVAIATTSVAVPEATRRLSPAAVKIENVISDRWYETEDDAKRDALKVAGRKIAEKLQTLDPPIVVSSVSPAKVWDQYVALNTARTVAPNDFERDALKDTKVSANGVRYRFDVEISESQLRELRGEGRVNQVAPFVFGGLVIAGIACVLLRLSGAAAAAVRRA